MLKFVAALVAGLLPAFAFAQAFLKADLAKYAKLVRESKISID